MERITWKKENGEWGLHGYDIKKVPTELYGALCKLKDYEEIGTVEECRKARERQRTRKPERKIQGEDLKIGCVTFKAGTKTYWCPSCKKPVTGSDSYCRWCGQSIDLYELK